MIVRLTDAQLAACRAYGNDVHRRWLGETTQVGKMQYDVEMPPIGWRTLVELLSDVAFSPYGRRVKRVPGSVHRAVKRIAIRLAWIEAHPAFHDQALPGELSDVFTTWVVAGERRPYPAIVEPDALLPEWLTVGGIRVTRWYQYSPSGWQSKALDPAEHLAFLSAADRSSSTRPASLDR